MKSPNVWEGRERLFDLAQDDGVELRWLPGHTGILGNEAADRLGREGSSATLVGPKPCLDIPGKDVRGRCKPLLVNTKSVTGLALQVKDSPRSSTGFAFAIDKENYYNLIGTVLGKWWDPLRVICALRKHLLVMGIGNNATCSGLASEDETAFNILFDYEAYAAHRFEHLGSHFVEPGEMRNISVGFYKTKDCDRVLIEMPCSLIDNKLSSS